MVSREALSAIKQTYYCGMLKKRKKIKTGVKPPSAEKKDRKNEKEKKAGHHQGEVKRACKRSARGRLPEKKRERGRDRE